MQVWWAGSHIIFWGRTQTRMSQLACFPRERWAFAWKSNYKLSKRIRCEEMCIRFHTLGFNRIKIFALRRVEMSFSLRTRLSPTRLAYILRSSSKLAYLRELEKTMLRHWWSDRAQCFLFPRFLRIFSTMLNIIFSKMLSIVRKYSTNKSQIVLRKCKL